MGYFGQKTTEKLALPSNSTYWVEVKTKLQYGDAKKFVKASTDGELDQEVAADIFLEEAIVSWNLDDDNGNVLPINDDTIAQLDATDAFFIIQKAGGEIDPKKDKSSPKVSGVSSTETT